MSERQTISRYVGHEKEPQLVETSAVSVEPSEVREVVVLVADPDNRSRLRAALEESSYRTVLPPQILTWAAAQQPQALLVTDDSDRTATMRSAIRTVAPGAACVVLVDEPTPARCRQLLTSCLAVLPSTASKGDLLAAMTAVDRYLACLPATAVHGLTGHESQGPAFASTELALLRQLADGAKVTALARAAGYSPREMYRMLADLYARLGAGTRTEALLRADRWGLLTDRPASSTRGPQSASADANEKGDPR